MKLSPQRLDVALNQVEGPRLSCVLKPADHPKHVTGVHLWGGESRDIPNDGIVLCHTLDGELGELSRPNEDLICSFSDAFWSIEDRIRAWKESKDTGTHYFVDRRPAAVSHALIHVVTPTLRGSPEDVKSVARNILRNIFLIADKYSLGIVSLPPLGMGVLGRLDPPEAAVLIVEGLRDYWSSHPEGGTTFVLSVDNGYFPSGEFQGKLDKQNNHWLYDLYAYESILNEMLFEAKTADNVVTAPYRALFWGFQWMANPHSFFRGVEE